MRLQEILTQDRVTVRLDAADKPSALRELARMFASATDDAERIAQVFEEREALASTGVGSGVAIPHGRMPGLDRLRAAVAITDQGVDFDAIDGRPAHILVAVLGPDEGRSDHLKALARFSRLLRKEPVRQRLRKARDPSVAYDIIVNEDLGR